MRDDALDRRLLAAAYRNDLGGARRLIAAGADVNAKDASQQSAYLIATLGEGAPAHTDTVRLLVDAGAVVNLPDKAGTTPLAHARQRDVAAIERILRQARAKP